MNLGKIDISTILSLLILKSSMLRSPAPLLVLYVLVAIVNASLFPITYPDWLLPLHRKANTFFCISFVTTCLINSLINYNNFQVFDGGHQVFDSPFSITISPFLFLFLS